MKFLSPEEYQPKANEIFELLKSRISTILPFAQIEHIGSSAIKNAVSKGDLDIFVGITTELFNQAIEKLQTSGFKIKADTLRTSELCMLECFDYEIDVAIQLVDSRSRFTDFLVFRDALLRSPTLVHEYNQLKIESAGLITDLYRGKKSDFINKVLAVEKTLPLNAIEFQYWNKYLNTLSKTLTPSKVYAAMPGNEEIADLLLNLYLSGKKTAGSGLVKDYETNKEALPALGDYWIALDSQKNPRCILKTIKIETHQFDEVPIEIAIAEGEGDLSLEYWRKVHTKFFTPYLKNWGIKDLNKEKVITEFYEMVFR